MMSLNVIGLISGGKDSLYSLVHCIQNGHKVVALANLHPAPSKSTANDDPSDGEGEDINSFMYQTVGHTIVPLYSEATGIPLYRRSITGKAIQTGRYYDTSNLSDSDLDETEDLLPLLRLVMNKHPEANAISSGAILSTYQRTRVESIALRLGLTPLAYLWQYPVLPPPTTRLESVTGLLDDMNAAACDARIIKIASGGIKERLLWANVADSKTRTQLLQGLKPFFLDTHGNVKNAELRGAVLGEGGEYETLAVDGPRVLWKKKIQVSECGSFGGDGGASYTKFDAAEVVDHDLARRQDEESLRVPVMLDKRFEVMNEALKEASRQRNLLPPAISETTSSTVISDQLRSDSVFRYRPTVTTTSTHLNIKNLTVDPADMSSTDEKSLPHPQEPEDELLDIICNRLPNLLSGFVSPSFVAQFRSRILSTTLLLSPVAMSKFSNLNSIYASHLWPIGMPNPPSRVTVAAPLSSGIHVSLSLTFTLIDLQLKKGLHVQGRSYWCPANIGPYSQAISVPLSLPLGLASVLKEKILGQEMFVSGLIPASDIATRVSVRNAVLPEIIHVAGQIPLVPASMNLLNENFRKNAILALQHLWRVGQERCVDIWPQGVAYLIPAPGHSMETQAENVSRMNEDIYHHKLQFVADIWLRAHQITENGTNLCAAKSFFQNQNSDTEEDDIDVWDLQYNSNYTSARVSISTNAGQHLHQLPNHRLLSSLCQPQILTDSASLHWVPPMIIPAVTALPRNADIEWWSSGLANIVEVSTNSELIQRKKITSFNTSNTKENSERVEHTMFKISGLQVDLTWDIDTCGTEEKLEREPQESRDNDIVTSERARNTSASIFATVLVANISQSLKDSNLVETIVRVAQNNSQKLETELDPCVWETEDATAFINTSMNVSISHLETSGPADGSLQGIVDRATQIPCHNVHACLDWNRSEFLRDPMVATELSQNNIEEVAIALLVRLSLR